LTKFLIFRYNVYHKPVRGILNTKSKQARIKKSLNPFAPTKLELLQLNSAKTAC